MLPGRLDRRGVILCRRPPLDRQLDLVPSHDDHRELGPFSLAVNVIEISSVELAVVDQGFERDRAAVGFGNVQGEVDNLAGPGGNLLVVERYEDVLRVASVDSVAVAVQHVDVDEM